MTEEEAPWPFADYEDENTLPPTLPYSAAVVLADIALTAIFDQLARPGSMITFDDRNTAGSAFIDWLWEHPDVYDALQYVSWFEPVMLEDYIETHSAAWEILVIADERHRPGDPIDPDRVGDGTFIRRRT